MDMKSAPLVLIGVKVPAELAAALDREARRAGGGVPNRSAVVRAALERHLLPPAGRVATERNALDR